VRPVTAVLVLVMAMTCILVAQNAQSARSALASAPRLVIAKSNIVAGDVVLVPVAIRAAPEVGTIEFELHYDSNALALSSIVKGSMLDMASTMESDLTMPGRAIVRIQTLQNPLAGNGELCKARIVVSKDAPQATHSLTLANVRAHRVARTPDGRGTEGAEVSLAVVSGRLRIIEAPVPIWVVGSVVGVLVIVVAYSLWTKPPQVMRTRRSLPTTLRDPPSLDGGFVI